ncbi:MAG TPA: glycerophosphoryl diester phosphodiesterase membrane domain-containing protein [Rhizobiaceae bacterium]|nr:glycerophosphoryl diester phosphodiesterase membrane domain-containing protein [Rhizobiaceae bacterium]
MALASAASPESFAIGRVLRDTFGIIGRNIGLCLGLLSLLCGLPALILEYSVPGTLAPGSDMIETSPTVAFTALVIYTIVAFVLGIFLLGALPRMAIDDKQGRRPSFDGCLSTGVAVALPVAVIAILTYLPVVLGIFLSAFAGTLLPYGSGIGFMLTIVLWTMLLLRWFLAIPIQVQERLGVFASLKRSATLTKGRRWSLLGLSVVLIVVLTIAQIALGLVAMLLPANGVAFGLAVASTAWTVGMVVASTVAYLELRAAREGSRA